VFRFQVSGFRFQVSGRRLRMEGAVRPQFPPKCYQGSAFGVWVAFGKRVGITADRGHRQRPVECGGRVQAQRARRRRRFGCWASCGGQRVSAKAVSRPPKATLPPHSIWRCPQKTSVALAVPPPRGACQFRRCGRRQRASCLSPVPPATRDGSLARGFSPRGTVSPAATTVRHRHLRCPCRATRRPLAEARCHFRLKAVLRRRRKTRIPP
jgi:hypothetical protein